MKGDGQWRLQLSALEHMKVVNPAGEKLGEIDDLQINLREGAIDSATLRLVADRTARSLKVAVPWSQLRLHSSGQYLVLNIGLGTLLSVASRRPGDRGR